MRVGGINYRTVDLDGPVLRLIEQRRLPHRFEIVEIRTHEAVADAIRDMVVRGAGAIGATGAAGVAIAAQAAPDDGFHAFVRDAAARLRATRPTAQNLFWAIDRVLDAMGEEEPPRAREAAIAAARAVADDDAGRCEAIGRHGRPLFGDGARVATHCNAGWLAFVDWGSALAPIYAAHRDGDRVHVWVDETRPRQQGAKLTAWELGEEGVPHAILADVALGSLLAGGRVDAMIVGADRIAANGDVANKIGTYPAAVLCRRHGVPFYVAAPRTTIDAGCPTGAAIPIETRTDDELCFVWGVDDDGVERRVRVAPPRSPGHNPAFDITPAELITGIVTDGGVIAPAEAGRHAAPSLDQRAVGLRPG